MSNKLLAHIDLCCQGKAEAFRYIVDEYQHMVYSLAFRLLCNEDDARDAAQETFIKAWLNISKYKAHYKLSTWIYKIASNVCYDKMRSRTKAKIVNLDECKLHIEADQIEILHNKELIELITLCTGKLSPKQRLVFTLSELEGIEVEEISIITGLTPAMIKSNLYLARKHIKSIIRIQNP